MLPLQGEGVCLGVLTAPAGVLVVVVATASGPALTVRLNQLPAVPASDCVC